MKTTSVDYGRANRGVRPALQNIAEIRFLRPISIRKPIAMTVSQREFSHDLVVAHIPIEQAGSKRYEKGTPVEIRWGTSIPNHTNRFYGYVHHTEPVYTRGGTQGRTQTLKLVCIGASYRLKQPRQRIWKMRTSSSIVREIVNGAKFSGDVQSHEAIWESVANPGVSDWSFIVGQAHRIGYTFFASNTDIQFHDRISRFRKLQRSAPVFVARQPGDFKGDSVYSFHAVVGETTPDGGDQSIRVVSGVSPRFAEVLTTFDRTGTPVEEQLAQLSFAPEFLKFETDTVVQSIGMASAQLEGAARKNRWHYAAKAEVTGVPSVRQGSPVFFDGLGPRDSGYWYVEGVEHVIRNNDYRMYLDLGRDSSFVTHMRPVEQVGRRVVRQRFDPFGTKKAALPPTTLVGGLWRSSWGAEREAM